MKMFPAKVRIDKDHSEIDGKSLANILNSLIQLSQLAIDQGTITKKTNHHRDTAALAKFLLNYAILLPETGILSLTPYAPTPGDDLMAQYDTAPVIVAMHTQTYEELLGRIAQSLQDAEQPMTQQQNFALVYATELLEATLPLRKIPMHAKVAREITTLTLASLRLILQYPTTRFDPEGQLMHLRDVTALKGTTATEELPTLMLRTATGLYRSFVNQIRPGHYQKFTSNLQDSVHHKLKLPPRPHEPDPE
jgi:hypothetical protein